MPSGCRWASRTAHPCTHARGPRVGRARIERSSHPCPAPIPRVPGSRGCDGRNESPPGCVYLSDAKSLFARSLILAPYQADIWRAMGSCHVHRASPPRPKRRGGGTSQSLVSGRSGHLPLVASQSSGDCTNSRVTGLRAWNGSSSGSAYLSHAKSWFPRSHIRGAYQTGIRACQTDHLFGTCTARHPHFRRDKTLPERRSAGESDPSDTP